MVKLIKFAIVGASGTIIGLGILYLLSDIAGLHYLIANTFAFAVAVTSNYILNSLWTFRQSQKARGWLKYAGVSAITLGINEGILWLLTERLGLWYMLSAVIAVGFCFLINYSLSRRLVWRAI